MVRGSEDSKRRRTKFEPMKPAEPVMRMDLLINLVNSFNFISLQSLFNSIFDGSANLPYLYKNRDM